MLIKCHNIYSFKCKYIMYISYIFLYYNNFVCITFSSMHTLYCITSSCCTDFNLSKWKSCPKNMLHFFMQNRSSLISFGFGTKHVFIQFIHSYPTYKHMKLPVRVTVKEWMVLISAHSVWLRYTVLPAEQKIFPGLWWSRNPRQLRGQKLDSCISLWLSLPDQMPLVLCFETHPFKDT